MAACRPVCFKTVRAPGVGRSGAGGSRSSARRSPRASSTSVYTDTCSLLTGLNGVQHLVGELQIPVGLQ